MRKIDSFLRILLFLIGFSLTNSISAQVATPPSQGDGSQANPYQIETLDHFYWLTQNNSEWDKNFIQTMDIDATSTNGWDDNAGVAPIGDGTVFFAGSYDGQGHTIEGVYINRPTLVNAGLFGRVDGGVITNLHLSAADITADRNVGGLVGYLISGTVSSCSVAGSVTSASSAGYSQSGGFVAYNLVGNINQCFANTIVTANKTNVGGFVGVNKGTIANCYVYSTVIGNEGVEAGLIAKNEGPVRNSYSVSHDENGAPIQSIGSNIGDISNCFWNSDATKEKGSNTSISTAEMQNLETFLTSGWDFVGESANGTDEIWGINCNENNGYPFLMFQEYAYDGTLPVADVATLPDVNGGCIVTSIPAPTATDNCDGTITGFTNAEFPIGQTTTITWYYTDYSGNTSTQTQTVIPADDNTPPTIQCIDDQNVTVTAHDWYTVIGEEFDPIATDDDCEVINAINDYNNSETLDGALIGEGETTINWTVTDYAGNTSSCSFMVTVTYNETPAGDGSEANPFQISNLDNLEWLMINDQHWNKHFIQTADIDASSTNTWSGGSGISTIGNDATHFTGFYDGQGYEIDGLYLNRTTITNVGLFGRVTGGSITRLNLKNLYIKANRNVGGLIGYLENGSVTACSVTGEVVSSSSENYSQSGGFIGYNNLGTVDQCFADCIVTGNRTNNGVLIGVNKGSVTNSYSFGKGTSSDGYVGRLVGKNLGSVDDCYSAATLGAGTSIGLFGTNTGTSSNCFWDYQASKNKNNGSSQTTAEMQDVQTYLDGGWDFVGESTNGTDDIWGINCNENNGYPFLMFQDYAFDGTLPVADEASLPDVNNECSVGSIAAPTATDNCDGSITGVADTEFPIGQTTTITWYFTDYSGNTITQTQNVTITDAIAPVADIADLPDITSECPIADLTAPTATDNCAGVISGTHNASLPIHTQGTTVITWSYTDNNGNETTQTQNVIIGGDTELPTISCINNQDITVIANNYYEVIGSEFDPLETSDNCGVKSIINDFTNTETLAGAHIPAGETTITWTVTDYADNFTTCETLFTIEYAMPEGNGTEDNPYQIANLDHLSWLMNNDQEWDKFYIQTADIDATSTNEWDDAAGIVTIGNNTTYFTGSYDGQGYHIDGLFLNRLDYINAGLFGRVDGGSISHLHLTNVNITADRNVGSLVGYLMSGSVTACSVTGTVTSISAVEFSQSGALVGYNMGTIDQCFVNATISANKTNTGGVSGVNRGLISNTYVLGALTCTNGYAGCIVGNNQGTIENCFAANTISTEHFGGIAGSSSSQNVINCFYDSEVAEYTSGHGTPLTSIEMKDAFKYINAGWDFASETTNGNADLWGMNCVDNDGYPFLMWQGFEHNTEAPSPDEISLADVQASCEVLSIAEPTATDDCDGQITGVANVEFPITQTVEITWTFFDTDGNSSTQTQNVIIEDAIAPVPDANSLADITAQCEVSELTAPTATDNCAGAIEATHDATLPITTQGTTVITWTFSDENENTATQTQNVIIEDYTLPTISCVENQSVTAAENEFYTVQGTEFDPTEINDNCGVASIINDFNNAESLAGEQIPVGVANIVWTVTDNAGNTASCTTICNVASGTDIVNLQNAGVKIYPNPAKHSVTVETGEYTVERLTFTDLTGRVIFTKEQPEKVELIDVSNINDGIYMINIQAKSTSFSTRFVKN